MNLVKGHDFFTAMSLADVLPIGSFAECLAYRKYGARNIPAIEFGQGIVHQALKGIIKCHRYISSAIGHSWFRFGSNGDRAAKESVHLAGKQCPVLRRNGVVIKNDKTGIVPSSTHPLQAHPQTIREINQKAYGQFQISFALTPDLHLLVFRLPSTFRLYRSSYSNLQRYSANHFVLAFRLNAASVFSRLNYPVFRHETSQEFPDSKMIWRLCVVKMRTIEPPFP